LKSDLCHSLAAHTGGYGKRFIVRADEMLTAFLELEIDGLRVGVNEPRQEMHSPDGIPLSFAFVVPKTAGAKVSPSRGHGQETLSSRLFTDQVSSAHQQR
jgi:hypothetical protein